MQLQLISEYVAGDDHLTRSYLNPLMFRRVDANTLNRRHAEEFAYWRSTNTTLFLNRLFQLQLYTPHMTPACHWNIYLYQYYGNAFSGGGFGRVWGRGSLGSGSCDLGMLSRCRKRREGEE